MTPPPAVHDEPVAVVALADAASDETAYDHFAQITVRGGYSRYYSFGFLTAGGELSLEVVDELQVVVGAEVYSVRRKLPPEVALRTGIYAEWAQVLPINIGAVYDIPLGRVQPYVGADIIFAKIYETSFAAGGRLRGGLDVMIVPNFGVNANLALGAWSGKRWPELEPGIGATGVLPQVSLGTLVAF